MGTALSAKFPSTRDTGPETEMAVGVGALGTAMAKQLKITYVGSQGADHPILSSLPETRYLKAVIVEEFGQWGF